MEYKYFFKKHIGRCVVISLEDSRYIKGWIKTADNRYVTLNVEKYIVWGIIFWRGITARVSYDAIKRCLLSKRKIDNDER